MPFIPPVIWGCFCSLSAPDPGKDAPDDGDSPSGCSNNHAGKTITRVMATSCRSSRPVYLLNFDATSTNAKLANANTDLILLYMIHWSRIACQFAGGWPASQTRINRLMGTLPKRVVRIESKATIAARILNILTVRLSFAVMASQMGARMAAAVNDCT